MARKQPTLIKVLGTVNAVLILIATALSLISSSRAYSFDTKLVILACVVTIALDVVCILLIDKLPNVVLDLAFFITAIFTALALCTVIRGRVLLVGYIYFSDLESSNPIAISAMNLAIGAWITYFAALLANFVIGFSKHAKD